MSAIIVRTKKRLRPFSVVITVAILTTLLSSCSSSNRLARSCYHKDVRLEQQFGVCQAVRVGDMLYVSGIVGTGDAPDAIKQAYDALARTLRLHGLSFDNVVTERIYSSKLSEVIDHKAIRIAYYNKIFPVSTWIEVERLKLSENVIEIEITAVIPSSFKIISYDSW